MATQPLLFNQQIVSRTNSAVWNTHVWNLHISINIFPLPFYLKGVVRVGSKNLFTGTSAYGGMDEAAVLTHSTARLMLTVYYCLREVCHRCGITINEQSAVTIRFGGPPTPPQPTTPPGHFLCCISCEQCSEYCCSRDPRHTTHLCHRHQAAALDAP